MPFTVQWKNNILLKIWKHAYNRILISMPNVTVKVSDDEVVISLYLRLRNVFLQGVECGGQNLLIKFPDNPVVGNGVGPRTTVLTKGAQNG